MLTKRTIIEIATMPLAQASNLTAKPVSIGSPINFDGAQKIITYYPRRNGSVTKVTWIAQHDLGDSV